jgi:hypothetical protein
MTTTTALVSLAAERPVPVRVVEVNRDSGFDWGDAGIGALGALALAAIGFGAALARHAFLGCVAALAVALAATSPAAAVAAAVSDAQRHPTNAGHGRGESDSAAETAANKGDRR